MLPVIDLYDQETLDGLKDIAVRRAHQELAARSRQQVARFFEGTDLEEPGLVRVEQWRPGRSTGTAGKSTMWGGMGCKR